MKSFIDTHDKNKGSFPEQEITEEQFFEQFAALEEGVALLQIHLRGMSENAKLFDSLAKHIRRSKLPDDSIAETSRVTTDEQTEQRAGLIDELVAGVLSFSPILKIGPIPHPGTPWINARSRAGHCAPSPLSLAPSR